MREIKVGNTKIIQYTVADLMQILSISKVTALKLLQSGGLKSIRIGRQYWINESHLLEYLRGESGEHWEGYEELIKTRIKNPLFRSLVKRLLKL